MWMGRYCSFCNLGINLGLWPFSNKGKKKLEKYCFLLHDTVKFKISTCSLYLRDRNVIYHIKPIPLPYGIIKTSHLRPTELSED